MQQQQQQHLLSSSSRAASHASSSSSSRAPCPRCPAPPLCWRHRHEASRPSLARKERAATLRVSLQRFDGCVAERFFFFYLVGGAGISLSPNPFSLNTKNAPHANDSYLPRTLRDRGETRCSSPWITRLVFQIQESGEAERKRVRTKGRRKKKPTPPPLLEIATCFFQFFTYGARSLLRPFSCSASAMTQAPDAFEPQRARKAIKGGSFFVFLER